MRQTNPLSDFVASQEAYKKGNKDEALSLLAKSVGAQAPTPMMRDNLSKLLGSGEPADVVLTLLMKEGDKWLNAR